MSGTAAVFLTIRAPGRSRHEAYPLRYRLFLEYDRLGRENSSGIAPWRAEGAFGSEKVRLLELTARCGERTRLTSGGSPDMLARHGTGYLGIPRGGPAHFPAQRQSVERRRAGYRSGAGSARCRSRASDASCPDGRCSATGTTGRAIALTVQRSRHSSTSACSLISISSSNNRRPTVAIGRGGSQPAAPGRLPPSRRAVS